MVLRKKSLKYTLLQVMAFLGDAGIEFLLNDFFRGKRVFIHRRHYSVDYCSRLLKEFTTTGYIERLTKGGTSYIRLTPQAQTKLKRDIPLAFFQKRRWDGYFRAIPYDFPEKLRSRRNSLRALIKSWGMGKFQRSLWITPHPLEEAIDDFISSQKLSPFSLRFTSRKLSIHEGQTISEKVWHLEKLEEKYLTFIEKWSKILANRPLTTSEGQKAQQDYFALLEKDPHLPHDLLPAYWPAKKAKNVFLATKNVIKNVVKKNVVKQS